MRGFITRILGPRITQAEYDEIVRDRDVYRTSYNEMHWLFLGKVDEVREERETVGRILRDKIEMGKRAAQVRNELAEAKAEIEALRPDAEAHRAKLSRDRDYHRNRRSLKTRALSLQPASPAMSESIGH